MSIDYAQFEGLDGQTPIQGHTIRIHRPRGANEPFRVECLCCPFVSMSRSLEEAEFDVRYHGLKQWSVAEPNWDKLL